jgi:phosphoglycerate dehydrogenase-like enzyme
MMHVLWSQTNVNEFGTQVPDLLRKKGLEVKLVHIPDDGSPVPAADVQKIEVACTTRDVRFSETRFKSFIDACVAAPNLKWLHFHSSGISQHKWLPPVMARGVRVTSASGMNAEPVAQTGMMGLLMLARPAIRWIAAQQRGEWAPTRGKEVPPDLEGQTAVIVGLGSIGNRMAQFCKFLRMRVIGVRRSPRRPDDIVDDVRPTADFKSLLPQADWVILCCPLTKETRHLVNAEAFALMKPTAGLINIARGEVVDEPVMIEVLKNRKILGAFLDVFTEEPLPASSPLWKLPNVILTPHSAGAAQGNEWRGAEFFINNLDAYAHGKPMLNEQAAP